MNGTHDNDTTADLEKTFEASQRPGDGIRALIDMMPSVAWRAQPDGSTAEDFRAWVFRPDDIERLREERREALLGSVPLENEQRLRRSDIPRLLMR